MAARGAETDPHLSTTSRPRCAAKEKRIPRAYRSEKRKLLEHELRQRIVEATVKLHAKKGTAATSYRDIAQLADVAVPTVYKHFPDIGSLLSACTIHAAAGAPTHSAELFSGKRSVAERIRALVRYRCQVHAYFDPWLKWGGDRVVPEIASLLAEDLSQTKKLVKTALTSGSPNGELSAETLNMTLLLLNYHSWSSLRFQLGLSPPQVEKQLANSLLLLQHVVDRPV